MNERILRPLACCALLGALANCTNPDRVAFVTSTQIGIGAERTPGNVSIGYDRYEGYLGPVYENGAFPPVIARIDSNLNVFEPEITQLYATGDAARIVTRDVDEVGPKSLKGDRRLGFFGTSTNIGLKLSFVNNAPESINLGYKRKEISLIPIGKSYLSGRTSEAEDVYGSVLAVLDLNLSSSSLPGTKLGVNQFFATGAAAEALAAQEDIRTLFKAEAKASLAAARLGQGDAERIVVGATSVDACVNPAGGAFGQAAKERLARIADEAVKNGTLSQVNADFVKQAESSARLHQILTEAIHTAGSALSAEIAANPGLCGEA